MSARKNAKTKLEMTLTSYILTRLKKFLAKGELGKKRGHRITHQSQIFNRRYVRRTRSRF